MDWNSYVFGVLSGLLLAMLCDFMQRALLGKSWQYTNPNKQRHPCKKQVDHTPVTTQEVIPTTTLPTGKTGRLVYDGRANLGTTAYEWMKCVDCHSIYPIIAYPLLGERASCNRTPITLCPWCRPDSSPNCYGRGN